jgi:hypothetical protein
LFGLKPGVSRDTASRDHLSPKLGILAGFVILAIIERTSNLSQDQPTIKMRPVLFSLLAATFTITALAQYQRPIMDSDLGPAMPPPKHSLATSKPADADTVILSDVLGKDRQINIFAGFTRDFAPISQRFDDSSLNTTILAPVNSAIMALPRKPWEDPEDYDDLGDNAYEGEKGEERARRNIRRFVEAHIVPASPWEEGDRLKTLAGGEVWWENKDGVKTVSSCGFNFDHQV